MSRIKIKLSNNQSLSLKSKLLITGSCCFLLAFFLFFFAGNFLNSEKSFAAFGIHGSKTVTSANTILNEYTDLTSNASSGTTTINVSSSSLNANGRFTSSLAAGELVMIIQMQGATIDTTNTATYGNVTAYNNCGNFEFAEVASISSTTKFKVITGLKNSYTVAGEVQVIRVPRYTNLIINAGASVTCPAWNGTTGGVIAIESNGTTVINGSIDASAKGFRGGQTEQNTSTPGNHTTYRSKLDVDGAEKGESIAGLSTFFSSGQYGRGAPANGGGGGNSHNAGGGGGANAGAGTWNGNGNPDNSLAGWTTAWNLEGGGFSANTSPGGGRGGYTWSNANLNPVTTAPGNAGWTGDNRYIMGGFGGHYLNYSTGRIFLGGGGGAGDSNNGVATPGGIGGGIVFLLSGGKVSGSGSIYTNGQDVPLSSGVPGDASGGGGGGGTIVIYTNGAQVTNISLNANGGKGGSQTLNNGAEVEGPGGGGGGGYISTTNPASLTRNVNGSNNGTTNAPPMVNFPPNGATKGGNGIITTNPPNPYSTAQPLPVNLISFKAAQNKNAVQLTWIVASEENNEYFTVERSTDGRTFYQLDRINGAGTSTVTKSYACMDNHPVVGLNYYRLSQTDFNGTSVSFKVISAGFNSPSAEESLKLISVSPNPFNEKVRVLFNCDFESMTQITLVSINGIKVLSTNVAAIKGVNQYEWADVSKLNKGTYILYIVSSSNKSNALTIVKN